MTKPFPVQDDRHSLASSTSTAAKTPTSEDLSRGGGEYLLWAVEKLSPPPRDMLLSDRDEGSIMQFQDSTPIRYWMTPERWCSDWICQ
jgi:hypothetical protein